MIRKHFKIPEIPGSEQTPVVKLLLDFIYEQQAFMLQQHEINQALKDEIAILKGEKPRPKIKPSKLEESTTKDAAKKKNKNGNEKRPGSDKRSKTAELKIHQTIDMAALNVPEGSRFKGYTTFTTQGIQIKLHNTLYRMEHWISPDGESIRGKLPSWVVGHFDVELRRYILYQYYHCHVTSPLLLEQLHEWKIDISTGQLSHLLVEGHEEFHAEKAEILAAGLEVSSYIQTDDTSARHKGKNWVCTHIGNEWFAWFSTSNSKSRINFLNLLRAGKTDYHLTEDAFAYMEGHKLAKSKLSLLKEHPSKVFPDQTAWEKHLDELGITGANHRRTITEGAMIGCLFEHGFNPKLVLLSDDAPQFRILLHALCWVHAERTIHKLNPITEEQRQAVKDSRGKIWDLYAALKDYKESPNQQKKEELEAAFDSIFQETTCYETLNQALKRLHRNKEELLLVLERPEIPLHNNGSESDMREWAKRRNISGSTRSDLGKECRDTFTSAKKTSRKNGISFWDYLYDRLSKTYQIPKLSDLIQMAAAGASP